jgi:hypothetical protein
MFSIGGLLGVHMDAFCIEVLFTNNMNVENLGCHKPTMTCGKPWLPLPQTYHDRGWYIIPIEMVMTWGWLFIIGFATLK